MMASGQLDKYRKQKVAQIRQKCNRYDFLLFSEFAVKEINKRIKTIFVL